MGILMNININIMNFSCTFCLSEHLFPGFLQQNIKSLVHIMLKQ